MKEAKTFHVANTWLQRVAQAIAFLLLFCAIYPAPAKAATSFPEVPVDDSGYALAVDGIALQFPRDHGSHPNFKSEWWYLTGHLQDDATGKGYGFQLTFFRGAQDKQQTYLAHAAVFDKETGAFLHEERLNSSLWNASAATGRLDVYNGNWYLRMEDDKTERMTARFSLADFGVIDMTLAPSKPKTLFGNDGYSAKGSDRGAASYYVTYTRLAVKARLDRGNDTSSLSGMAWMDHEFSSSQLSSGQIGWNWTSLILDDGTELMAYVMRRSDGKTDPYSSLYLIEADGNLIQIGADSFQWIPTRYWQSKHGARYPVDYDIEWTQEGKARSVSVKALGDEQELRDRIGSFVYWEGACQAFDSDGNPIGLGYTELTGYHESLNGRF